MAAAAKQSAALSYWAQPLLASLRTGCSRALGRPSRANSRLQPRKSFAVLLIVVEVKVDGAFVKTVSIFLCSLAIASSQTSSLPVIGPVVFVAAAVVVVAIVVVVAAGAVLDVDAAVEVAFFPPHPVTSKAQRATG
jgi:hypothetical protein